MRGFSIGQVFGVRLALHWTVVIIFALITFQLGAIVFPLWHPEWSGALSWGVALGAAVVFLASILIHEMAHALVGRAYGIPVRSITLFMLGGVANVERRPPSPRSEFLMAIAGPVTSLLLGIGFVLLSASITTLDPVEARDAEQAAAALGPFATLLAWVGPINILLAIFNMIPGFPLDGGRVLRAILWGATGDLMKATRWAARMGRMVAVAFVIIGILMAFGVAIPFLGFGLGAGLWMVLIGWFLHSIATAGLHEVYVERVLADLQVRDLMASHPDAVDPDLTVRGVVDNFFMRSDQHAFPAVRGDKLVGLVCLEDVRNVPRDAWDSIHVSEVMTPVSAIETVAPDDDAIEGVRKLGRREVAQLPVVENGVLRGLFRSRDVARWIELNAGTGSGWPRGRAPSAA